MFHSLTVADVTTLCDDAVAVTFDVPDELTEEFAFRPGQSVILRRVVDGREERRNYSICAPAGAAPRIGVREVTGGLFSTWLVRDVHPGDRVDVAAPEGRFTPGTSTSGGHVMIVAGSGITPALSIVASVLGDSQSTVTMLYGNRRASTVMFADELAELKDRYPARFQLLHVLSREPRDADVLTGRLDATRVEELFSAIGDPADVDHWWLCGPLAMVTDIEELLARIGIPPERVHHELFYVGDDPPPPATHPEPGIVGASSEVTVILDSRSTVVTIPRESTILEGAQRVRPDMPFACKGGVCGTCRGRVVAGEVDLRRNFALEPAELAAGFVLTCQSRPTTDEVVIDFDS